MTTIKLKRLIREEVRKALKEAPDDRLIEKFKEFIGDEEATDLDIEYFSYKNKLTTAQQALLKKTFLSDFGIKSTGPLPPDIKPKFGR